MKKDWLEDIHDRMADFEVDAPQGLWDDICQAEAKATPKGAVNNHDETPAIGPLKHGYRIWIGSTAATAACLLLLWVIRPYREHATGIPSLPTHEMASTDHSATPEEHVLPDESEQAELLAHAKEAAHAIKATHAIESTHVIESTQTIDSAHAIEAAQTKEIVHDVQPILAPTASDEKCSKSVQAVVGNEKNITEVQNTRKWSNNAPRLTVSLSTTGGLGTNNLQHFNSGYASGASMLSESDWVDSPLLGIMTLNRGAETERQVTHHAPIRTGLSFTYRLNDRWSIESGITYAFASSDIHEGSISNFIEEEQRLHYVGIPLGVTYRLFTWKRLDLYISSNILAEQCVSGQLHKKYIIDNKAQGAEETSSIQSRPMQWSVGARAGVQYNLNPLLSIYAEPGCGYYFDDHSSLETVFKDKAFDFNLNLGLRFSVRKK